MKCAIYTRQSVEKLDSLSIDAQIEKCIQLCNYKGWEYSIYKDSGYSGSNINRPDFERLMSDVSTGGINKIITYRLDRISRNIADFADLLKLFETHNVDFFSVTENFDTSTPMGRAMIMIIMVFAQLERETIAERIKDSAMHRASLGRFPGGPVPMGFNKERITEGGKTRPVLLINSDEATIVKMFYDWYLESSGSIRSNVHRANQLGMKTKNGVDWNCNQMGRILQNAIYVKNDPAVYDHFSSTSINVNNELEDFDGQNACMYYRRRKNHEKTSRTRDISEQYIMVAEHQGIIESDKWLAAQYKISANKDRPPRLGNSLTSILAGLVRCGKCGGSMNIYQTQSRGHKYRYFKCRRKETQGVCMQTSIRADLLELDVEKALFQYCRNIKHLEQNADIQIDVPEKTQKSMFQKKIQEINGQIDNFVDSLGTKKESSLFSYIEKKVHKLESERKAVQKQLDAIENQLRYEKSTQINYRYVLDLVQDFENLYASADDQHKKMLIKSLIKEIIITDKDHDIVFFLKASR